MSRSLVERIKQASAGMTVLIPQQRSRGKFKAWNLDGSDKFVVIDSIGGGPYHQYWVAVHWPCGRKLIKPDHAGCTNPDCVVQKVHDE